MASRTTPMQSAHDIGVQKEANELLSRGWNVAADIKGYPNPPTINGRIPDVYATKNGRVRIVEIETDRSDDRLQHTAFRRHAGQKNNASFYGYIVDTAGRRIEKFH